MRILRLNPAGSAHIIAMTMSVVVVGAVGTYLLVGSHASSYTHSQILDISYPQCGKRFKVEKAVIGVNNGHPLSRNPCMKKQARQATDYAIYANTSYVSKHYMPKGAPCASNTPGCWAYNTGWRHGKYSLKYSSKAGVYSKLWWLDVEQLNKWGTDKSLNVRYLDGMSDSLTTTGHTVGYYSTGYQWDKITGGWQNNHPSWIATGIEGTGARASSLGPCSKTFTGGSVWLVQYVRNNLDIDFACNSSFGDAI